MVASNAFKNRNPYLRDKIIIEDWYDCDGILNSNENFFNSNIIYFFNFCFECTKQC